MGQFQKVLLADPFEGLLSAAACETLYGTKVYDINVVQVAVFAIVIAIGIFGSKKVDDFIRVFNKEYGIANKIRVGLWSKAAFQCFGWLLLVVIVGVPLMATLVTCQNIK